MLYQLRGLHWMTAIYMQEGFELACLQATEEVQAMFTFCFAGDPQQHSYVCNWKQNLTFHVQLLIRSAERNCLSGSHETRQNQLLFLIAACLCYWKVVLNTGTFIVLIQLYLSLKLILRYVLGRLSPPVLKGFLKETFSVVVRKLHTCFNSPGAWSLLIGSFSIIEWARGVKAERAALGKLGLLRKMIYAKTLPERVVRDQTNDLCISRIEVTTLYVSFIVCVCIFMCRCVKQHFSVAFYSYWKCGIHAMMKEIRLFMHAYAHSYLFSLTQTLLAFTPLALVPIFACLVSPFCLYVYFSLFGQRSPTEI